VCLRTSSGVLEVLPTRGLPTRGLPTRGLPTRGLHACWPRRAALLTCSLLTHHSHLTALPEVLTHHSHLTALPEVLTHHSHLTALPEGVTGYFYRAECGDGAAHDGYRVVAGACLPRPSPAFVHGACGVHARWQHRKFVPALQGACQANYVPTERVGTMCQLCAHYVPTGAVGTTCPLRASETILTFGFHSYMLSGSATCG
jgi:hypothetical protein